MRMRTAIAAGVATGAAALVLGAVALTASGPSKAVASSHREAPLIANDPTADLTDYYLFPSPDKAGTVTMIANVIPLEAPPEGPNYYNLDDSARYRFNIDWNGDGKAERTWTLRTKTTTAYPGTFLYNIGAGQLDQRPEPQRPPDLDAVEPEGRWPEHEDRRGHHGAQQRRQELVPELRGRAPAGDHHARQRHARLRRAE